MSLNIVFVYDDDSDAHVLRRVTATDGSDLTFPALAAIGEGPYDVAATWVGDVGTTRLLRVPVAGVPLGTHQLYLSVPGGNDLSLGSFAVITRK